MTTEQELEIESLKQCIASMKAKIDKLKQEIANRKEACIKCCQARQLKDKEHKL